MIKKIIILIHLSPWWEENDIFRMIINALLKAVIHDEKIVWIKDYHFMATLEQWGWLGFQKYYLLRIILSHHIYITYPLNQITILLTKNQSWIRYVIKEVSCNGLNSRFPHWTLDDNQVQDFVDFLQKLTHTRASIYIFWSNINRNGRWKFSLFHEWAHWQTPHRCRSRPIL